MVSCLGCYCLGDWGRGDGCWVGIRIVTKAFMSFFLNSLQSLMLWQKWLPCLLQSAGAWLVGMGSGDSMDHGHPYSPQHQLVLRTSVWSLVAVQTTDINTALCCSIGHRHHHSPRHLPNFYWMLDQGVTHDSGRVGQINCSHAT